MARITIATRNYWMTLVLTALLFVFTVALTATSMAKVRGGDDEGSGFGGTGRTGDFGGTGFGGTGESAPWVGYDEEGEKARRDLDQLREDLRPVDVPETLRESVNNNLLQERIELARAPSRSTPAQAPVSTEFADIGRRMSEPQATLEVAQPMLDLVTPRDLPPAPVEVAPFELAAVPVQETAGSVKLEQDTAQEQTQIVQSFQSLQADLQGAIDDVSQSSPVSSAQSADGLADASDSATPKEERLVLPERIQRPELPPIQRMRPAVERITISPPRPQPMRI